ncbi:hypothetical protein AMJ52_03785 [candidate division TA06 bacterium DG_78]|uniref:Uncharacterized protein n=1 Tax=candidate division TA06 bacterium DG_78 TaxID=1703772 RepID=A0A0S7YH42_UNCT6|nr:MAG: hypothetical protein AMJ52_03785 [candidate division TA06 bacterium DG_78]
MKLLIKTCALAIPCLILGCASLQPQYPESTEPGVGAEKAAVLYEKGNDYFKQKEYAAALTKFDEIVTKYRNTNAYEPALYLAAFCNFKLNNFEKAVSLGEKFINEFPNSTYLLNATSLLGESYYKLAEDYKAAYYLTKFYIATEDSAKRGQAFDRIVKVLPELSISELEKLHRIFMAEPIDEHILFNLAQLEAREGKEKEAERDFGLLVRRFPNTKYIYEIEEYRRFIGLGEATGRVGILLPLTGNFSSYGQRLLDVVKKFQQDKSLPFFTYYLDTKSDPIEAMNAAAKLIEDMHVDFLIAPIRVYEVLGVVGLAYGKRVPLILPLTSESRFESIPLVFTTAQSDEEQAKALAEYCMYDLGIRRYAVLYPDILKYKTIAETFANAVVKSNRDIVAMVHFHPDSITLKWELEGMKHKEPEAIFLPMDTDMIINTAPQIAYYGLEEVLLLGISTFHDEKVPRLGEKYVEGAVFVTSAAIDSLARKEFYTKDNKDDDLTARFFRVMWQLRELKDYERTTLPHLIPTSLGSKVVFDIYQIEGYEFKKVAEITKEHKE